LYKNIYGEFLGFVLLVALLGDLLGDLLRLRLLSVAISLLIDSTEDDSSAIGDKRLIVPPRVDFLATFLPDFLTTFLPDFLTTFLPLVAFL
jgi:hypothetical protein